MNNENAVILRPLGSYDHPEEIRAALLSLLEGMGGTGWIRPGMVIALKVNLVSGMAPEKAGTTHPALIRELARILHEKGAEVIIGDSPGGLFTHGYVSGVYRACALPQICSDGITLNDDFSIEQISFPEAVSIKSFQCTAWLKKADVIINFAKLKTHAMMSLSCSVKNMFGAIPGVQKPECHMRFPDPLSFANVMVDLNEYFKPVFHLVDAVTGMEGNGPTAGTPRHIGLLLGSRSPYNLDMVCAGLIGLKREDVPTLQAAYERGLGPAGVQDVHVDGDLQGFAAADYQLVTKKRAITFGSDGARGRLVSGFMKLAFASKPQVKQKECIACGKCAAICPAHAIRMGQAPHKYPEIDRKKCIHCFCCQEFCPKGAMKVHHNPVGVVAGKINTDRGR